MFDATEATGAELNFDTTYKPVSFLKGKLIKHFDVISPVLMADGVLNQCKLKTHMFMSITGAVKNNFGVIPGLAKPGYHANLWDKNHFADMLLDLAEYVSPRLSIMDAVTGMEGDGPGVSGTPRRIGLLLGSKNPLALDVVASEIIGLPLAQNPLLTAAARRGLPASIEEIDVIGADISKIRISDYRLPATVADMSFASHLTWWQKPLEPYIRNWLSQAPQVADETCIGCGICRDSCPKSAITIVKKQRKYAHIDEKVCIRCYCCHELCPEGAVDLRRSFMHRVLGIGVRITGPRHPHEHGGSSRLS
jgi:ferredoxin